MKKLSPEKLGKESEFYTVCGIEALKIQLVKKLEYFRFTRMETKYIIL